MCKYNDYTLITSPTGVVILLLTVNTIRLNMPLYSCHTPLTSLHDQQVLILLFIGVGVIRLDLGLFRPWVADHSAVGSDVVDTALAGDRHILSPVTRIRNRNPDRVGGIRQLADSF